MTSADTSTHTTAGTPDYNQIHVTATNRMCVRPNHARYMGRPLTMCWAHDKRLKKAAQGQGEGEGGSALRGARWRPPLRALRG